VPKKCGDCDEEPPFDKCIRCSYCYYCDCSQYGCQAIDKGEH